MDCIETSCKIATIKISPHQPITKSVCVQFALNRNGSLHTLTLVQSSGNKDMDTTILDIFKDASSAFPPVPALFQEPYRFPTVTFLSPNDPQNRHVKRTLTIRHY